MNKILQSTLPNEPKTKESVKAAYLYAGILVIFALGQLFTFDEFIKLLISFNFIGSPFTAKMAGGMFVVLEVFALPFLLQMRIPKYFRIASMIFGILVPLGWLKISLWLSLTSNIVTNIGFVGTKIEIIPGWWTVSFSIALVLLSAWACWGLWPIASKINIKNKK